MQAVQAMRADIADMIFHRLADGFYAAEHRLKELLPQDVISEVRAHIQVPRDLNSVDGDVHILQVRTFTVQGVMLGRCKASIRWEDNKLIPEVKTEWYLDETQLRNLRVQGDFVFPA